MTSRKERREMNVRRNSLFAFALALVAGHAPARGTPLPAMPMNMSMPGDHVAQNPPLLASLVAAGGRPFSTAHFLRTASGGNDVETRRLRQRFGDAKLAEFERVFDYVVARSVAAAPSLPAPAIGAAGLGPVLYRAGLRHGIFEVELLFDRLFGPEVHDRVMVDAGRRFGGSGEAAYHEMFAALVRDLATPRRRP